MGRDNLKSLGGGGKIGLPEISGRRTNTEDSGVYPAKDACKCLELGNVSQTCSRLDEDERGIVLTDTPSDKQEMLVVSEPVVRRKRRV